MPVCPKPSAGYDLPNLLYARLQDTVSGCSADCASRLVTEGYGAQVTEGYGA